MTRLGIFGGSFDPPHQGHLRVAQSALLQLELDRLLWIPAFHSPFKSLSDTTNTSDRKEMVRLMTLEDPKFELDLRELHRKGPSYTVDTLESLRQEEPDAELYLILGGDSLAELSTWKRADRIREICQVVAYQRLNDSHEVLLDAALCDRVLSGDPIELSSSAIRDAVSKKFPIDRMVTGAVAKYIEAHGLYLQN